MLRQVVEYFVAVTEDKGMLETESFNDLVKDLKVLVGHVQKYCQDKEALRLEGINCMIHWINYVPISRITRVAWNMPKNTMRRSRI